MGRERERSVEGQQKRRAPPAPLTGGVEVRALLQAEGERSRSVLWVWFGWREERGAQGFWELSSSSAEEGVNGD